MNGSLGSSTLRPVRSAAVAAMAGLALVAAAGAASAGVTVDVQPATQSVAPGSEFEVSLEIPESGSAFNAFDAIVGHDPAALTLVEISPLSLQEGALIQAACPNRFHRFRRGTDRDTITVVLLCSGVSVTGPGQIYRLRFLASTTPQTTQVRILPGIRFYEAGIAVTPVTTTDATVVIGAPVDVGPGSRGPASLALWASPNPSRSLTVLHLESGAAGHRELVVTDVLGRAVRRLADGWFAAGRRDVAWDGRDDSGTRVPAGVYFAELRTRHAAARATVVRLQ